jgi:glutamine synthetase
MNNSILEYIWLGGNNEIRGKTKILQINENHEIKLEQLPDWNYDSKTKILPTNENPGFNLEQLPIWNYDGSSTKQADGSDSEVILHPVRLYHNPFELTHKDSNNNCLKNYIVLCDTYLKDGTPHSTNTRYQANDILSKHLNEEPWYGIEQEFFMIDNNTHQPLGFNTDGSALPQGQYYCSVGAGNCYGRNIAQEMLNKCLEIGLNITGLNFEVAPGQCELQIREEGLKAADDLILMRYVLQRVAEKHNVRIDFSAKPIKGDWNGSGCHVNFSTKQMREPGGYQIILDSMPKLERKHLEHIKVYGDDNSDRLTGKHETSSMEKFSFGVADRGASVRIPNSTKNDGMGYFEDRRPSSSMDPYLVLSKLLDTVCSDLGTKVYLGNNSFTIDHN